MLYRRQVEEVRDLPQCDGLNVACAAAGLGHRRGIDLELHGRVTACLYVCLEARRKVDDESKAACIHRRVDLVCGYVLRGYEVWGQESIDDSCGKHGAILIDDRHRGIP